MQRAMKCAVHTVRLCSVASQLFVGECALLLYGCVADGLRRFSVVAAHASNWLCVQQFVWRDGNISTGGVPCVQHTATAHLQFIAAGWIGHFTVLRTVLVQVYVYAAVPFEYRRGSVLQSGR